MKRATIPALALMLFATSGLAQRGVPPLNRYNSIAETTYQLHLCGELTSERRDWLRHLRELAMRPLDWTPAQWAEHDANLTADLQRLFPKVAKARCAELVRMIDSERKNFVRSK